MAPRVIFADTHCHLDMKRFDADRELVLQRASRAGVRRLLLPSLDVDSARRILALSESHPAVYGAVGFHPTQVEAADKQAFAAIREFAAAPKVVAIGEIGLDYYWVKEADRRFKQQDLLRLQLQLAAARDLPVVLHMREENDAHDGTCAVDLMAILRDWVRDLRSGASDMASRPGVLHSFSGTLETAFEAIGLGFYIGVTGPVTYPSADRRREIVRQLPMDKLLIETDAPFLAPHGHRGQRNEPAFVTDIADRIAEIQSKTVSEVAHITSDNARRLFDWGEPE